MSTPKYDGGAAYPVPMFTRQADGQPMSAGGFFEGGKGMTLRDYIAAGVLHTLVDKASPVIRGSLSYPDATMTKLARTSYQFADAMLSVRNE